MSSLTELEALFSDLDVALDMVIERSNEFNPYKREEISLDTGNDYERQLAILQELQIREENESEREEESRAVQSRIPLRSLDNAAILTTSPNSRTKM